MQKIHKKNRKNSSKIHEIYENYAKNALKISTMQYVLSSVLQYYAYALLWCYAVLCNFNQKTAINSNPHGLVHKQYTLVLKIIILG